VGEATELCPDAWQRITSDHASKALEHLVPVAGELFRVVNRVRSSSMRRRSIALFPLIAITSSSAGQSPDDWQRVAKQALGLVVLCYERQSIHALESELDFRVYQSLIQQGCKEQRIVMGQALAGGLRAQGYSDTHVEETVINLLSDIEVKAAASSRASPCRRS
jgi:hypothetical protein